MTQEQREVALSKRHRIKGAELALGTKDHLPLVPGMVVMIQNQVGPRARKWDKSGVVVADMGHSQYKVRVDGSGRITLRNRSFLKRIVPYSQVRTEAESKDLDLKRNKYEGPELQARSPERNDKEETVEGAEKQVGSEAEAVLETARESVQLGVRYPAGDGLRRSSRQVSRPEKYPK